MLFTAGTATVFEQGFDGVPVAALLAVGLYVREGPEVAEVDVAVRPELSDLFARNALGAPGEAIDAWLDALSSSSPVLAVGRFTNVFQIASDRQRNFGEFVGYRKNF